MKATSPQTDANARWWDTLAGLLLLCALLTAATRLVITQWTEDLHTIQLLTLLGGSLGLALGRSRFSRRISLLLSSGYGFFLIFWYLGAPMMRQIPWKERMFLLGHRLSDTFNLMAQSQPVNDNILFLLLMSLLFWFLSVAAGFSMARWGASWWATLPAGLVLMVIHAYDPLIPRRAWFLAAYLLFALLLVARLHYTRQHRQWQQSRTYFPPDIGFDWIRYTLVAAVLLIVFAWSAPALSSTLPAARSAWQKARQPWDDFSERAGKMFNSLQASVGIVQEQYSDSLALGRGTPLADTLVMSVEAPPRPIPGIRYYWRAYAYDQYASGSWSSTLEESQVVLPDDRSLTFANSTGRVINTFRFTPENAIVTLYTPSQPVWVDVPMRAQLAVDPDGTADIAALNSTSIVMPGQTYEVRASLAAVTVSDLRQAGEDYPEWILERYTQLPEDITPRTKELAEKIAEGLETPYDIAYSVTEFLRGYEYQETMPPLPTNRELVDWWLFDYQAGFCQYYASAQVVLLRSLGIPARLAVGYAQGEFEGRSSSLGPQMNEPELEDFTDTGGIYRVRALNAHAWPEVYFPGIGWVEFEPTASESSITRPPGSDLLASASLTEAEREQEERERERLFDMMMNDFLEDFDNSAYSGSLSEANQNRVSSYWWIFAPLLLTSATFYLWRRRQPRFNVVPLPLRMERGLRRLGINPPRILQRWSHRASLSPFTASYLEINRALRRLGSPPAARDTPSERAVRLVELLPEAAEAVMSLLEQYQLSVYSKRPADMFAARRAAEEIRKQSYQGLLRSMFAWVEGLRVRLSIR
jgi:transglutaminase-like putative cysteine protease